MDQHQPHQRHQHNASLTTAGTSTTTSIAVHEGPHVRQSDNQEFQLVSAVPL